MLNSNKDKDVVSILKNAKRSIEEFVSGAPQFDDMTMLVFTYKGV